MTQFLRQTFFAALACVFPGAAWAQLTNTVSLTANTALNLDTGATGTTGASILWTGSQISFQGSAKGYSLGPEGSATYAALTQSTLPTFASLETTAAIPAATLVVGEVFIVTTVGGNPAKLLVAGVSGTTITLTYTTYGVAAAPAGPTITGVTNNYSYTPAGFANSGISPGSLFVIFGTGLSTSTTAVLQNTLVGLPATLNGASVSVTVGGITVHPGLYYAVASAIAAVLPSSTPTGSGTMTVTNGTTSAAFSIQVVASAMGFDTYYGTGNGLLVVTDPSGNLITYTNSAKPGNTYTLWGSGLGADTADSDTVFTGTPHAVSTPFALYVGNQLATVSYKGSSGYPGVDIINFVMPNNVTPGCDVSVIGISNSDIITNAGVVPVGTNGGICVDSEFGINGSQVQTQSGQNTVSSGALFVTQSTSNLTGTSQTAAQAAAIFTQNTGSSYGSGSGLASVGSCTVSESVTGSTTSTSTGLNVGTITVTQPGGSPVTLMAIPQEPGDYFGQLATISPTGGTFTFTGSGGTGANAVGPFTASVTFPNPLLVWTNEPAAATVTRANGLTVNWTGGASGSYVVITGSSSSGNASGFYTCIAPVAAGTFAVPYYVLLGLPAGSGSTAVSNNTAYGTFAASGINLGFSYGGLGFNVSTTYN